MSTVSNCTKTSADSSWGREQIYKEIYININEDKSNCVLHEDVSIVQDSCDGHIQTGSSSNSELSH